MRTTLPSNRLKACDSPKSLEAWYREMPQDTARENEAEEWCEGLLNEVCD